MYGLHDAARGRTRHDGHVQQHHQRDGSRCPAREDVERHSFPDTRFVRALYQTQSHDRRRDHGRRPKWPRTARMDRVRVEGVAVSLSGPAFRSGRPASLDRGVRHVAIITDSDRALPRQVARAAGRGGRGAGIEKAQTAACYARAETIWRSRSAPVPPDRSLKARSGRLTRTSG